MNRRLFLQRFGVGIVSALALAHVPAAVVKAVGLEEPARRYATEHLLKVWNEVATHKKWPVEMHAGRELFEAFENELPVYRRFAPFDDPKSTFFKCAKLRCVGSGWYTKVVA